MWPVVVVLVLTGIAGIYELHAEQTKPPAALVVSAETQTTWLVRYCDAIEGALEASSPAGSGQLTVNFSGPLAAASTNFNNFYVGATRTVQCWMTTPPAEVNQQVVSIGSGGSDTAGIAASTTAWESSQMGVVGQSLIHSLPASEVGTIVVMSGY